MKRIWVQTLITQMKEKDLLMLSSGEFEDYELVCFEIKKRPKSSLICLNLYVFGVDYVTL